MNGRVKAERIALLKNGFTGWVGGVLREKSIGALDVPV
jgi:hypothetical protein